MGKRPDDLVEPGSFTEMVYGFLHAVDWSERWLVGLGGVYIFLIVFVVLGRRSQVVRVGVYTMGLLVIMSAESINAYGAAHWREFATQNYFDPNGLFVSVVLSTPILLLCTSLLVYSLYEASTLIVAVGKEKLKAKARAHAQNHHAQNHHVKEE